MIKSILTLIITSVFVLSANAYEVPKDAVIKVYTKDGKQIGEMSRKYYKVVKIENDEKLQEERKKIRKEHKEYKKYRDSHNSIIVHAGAGKDGLGTSHSSSGYSVEEKDSMVFGATYCYTKKTNGLCATGMTNKTVTIGIKKDF